MLELHPEVYAYSHFFIMVISIIAFELVLYSLKGNIVYGKTMTIYKIYFTLAIIGWIVVSINEIIYHTIDLSTSILFYCVVTFLLFLAFTEKRISSKTSLFILFISVYASIISILFSDNFSILLNMSIYIFITYSYLLYQGIKKSYTLENMGYAIMTLGFFIVLLSSIYQIYCILILNNLNITYSIGLASGSIGFILVGIGLLSSILVAEHKSLRSLSLQDPLTGMYNRRGLDYLLQLIIPSVKRNKKSISAIAIDIDFFKKINDKYGHDGGDEVLKSFAQMIQACPRTSDLSSRLGGEEFVIILPDTGLEGALVIAEKIRKSVEDLCIPYNNDIIKLSSSFGVSTQSKTIEIDTLLKNADKALYTAKAEGRNRVCHTDIE